MNLTLGLVVLSGLPQQNDFGWLQLGTGAICCVIAGWLAATAWSKSIWSRSTARQIAVCGQIVDTLFTWIEDLRVPADALVRLRSSLEEAVPGIESGRR